MAMDREPPIAGDRGRFSPLLKAGPGAEYPTSRRQDEDRVNQEVRQFSRMKAMSKMAPAVSNCRPRTSLRYEEHDHRIRPRFVGRSSSRRVWDSRDYQACQGALWRVGYLAAPELRRGVGEYATVRAAFTFTEGVAWVDLCAS